MSDLLVSTWWLILLSKWVITTVISGLTLLIPFITGVITHLLTGMSHQVDLEIQHFLLETNLPTPIWQGLCFNLLECN